MVEKHPVSTHIERISEETGLSLMELMVSMVIVAIVGLAASEVLIAFYHGNQQAVSLSNRVAKVAMLDDVMDHTVAQAGYGESAPSISVTISSVTAAWSSGGQSCTGVMKIVQGGMAWTVSSMATAANAACGAGTAFLPVGGGWEFSLQPDTNCNYNAGTTFPELVATNQSAKLEVPVCLRNLPGQ